jgi:hypothetical protein
MKKVLVYFIIGFSLLSCKGQNQEFNDYISNFQEFELPFIIDDVSNPQYRLISSEDNEIPVNYIKKYICKDSIHCDYDQSKYRYTYGFKFKSKYTFVFLLKLKYKGKTCYDFDLLETLLIVYSKDGKIIDEKSIAKDNNCWQSSIWVTDDSIKVQQIKVIELADFNDMNKELDCEIETKIYQIGDDGYINLIKTEPIKKGELIWDKNIDNVILKQ